MVSSKYAWRPLLQVSGVLFSAIGARLLGAQEVRGVDFPPKADLQDFRLRQSCWPDKRTKIRSELIFTLTHTMPF